MKKVILLAASAGIAFAVSGCALWDQYGDQAISAINEYVASYVDDNSAQRAESVEK